MPLAHLLFWVELSHRHCDGASPIPTLDEISRISQTGHQFLEDPSCHHIVHPWGRRGKVVHQLTWIYNGEWQGCLRYYSSQYDLLSTVTAWCIREPKAGNGRDHDIKCNVILLFV